MFKETTHQTHVQKEVLCSNFGQATGYPNTLRRHNFFKIIPDEFKHIDPALVFIAKLSTPLHFTGHISSVH